MSGICYFDTPEEREWAGSPSQYCGEFSKGYGEIPQKQIDSWLTRYETNYFSASSAGTAAAPAPDLEEKFRKYSERWERETAFISATPMRVMHESYQSIMSMGPDVIPVLLNDLQKTQRHWFWALRHLAGLDPVPEKDNGDVDRMIAAWIGWGKATGKI